MVIPQERPVAEVMKEPPGVVITPVDPTIPPWYIEDGLRRVRPYFYTYNTYCKERWRGKSIFSIFASEFRDRPEGYYKQAIIDGQIYINGKATNSPEEIIRNGDIISHTLHRHEPPVTGKPVEIIHEDENIICINKPSGIPVHPTGRYNYNSVIEIMKFERGGWNPLPCNRLDRLTSGLMFIAKTVQASTDMMIQLRTRTVKKEYVALVVGKFPDGDIYCEQPVLSISPKLGLNQVRANGKYAKTLFRRLSYNTKKDYSIVQCLPFTGRTHQIRVHLQFLGHPIANDPIYSNRKVFGPNLGQGGTEGRDDDIITRLSRMGKEEVAEAVAYYDEMVEDYEKKRAEKMSGELCPLCDTPLYTDPGQHELGIYLHARKYQCVEGRWAYETALPDWAIPKIEDGTIISEGLVLEDIEVPPPSELDDSAIYEETKRISNRSRRRERKARERQLGRETDKEPEMCASLAELEIKDHEEGGEIEVEAEAGADGQVSDKHGKNENDVSGTSAVAGGELVEEERGGTQ